LIDLIDRPELIRQTPITERCAVRMRETRVANGSGAWVRDILWCGNSLIDQKLPSAAVSSKSEVRQCRTIVWRMMSVAYLGFLEWRVDFGNPKRTEEV